MPGWCLVLYRPFGTAKGPPAAPGPVKVADTEASAMLSARGSWPGFIDSLYERHRMPACDSRSNSDSDLMLWFATVPVVAQVPPKPARCALSCVGSTPAATSGAPSDAVPPANATSVGALAPVVPAPQPHQLSSVI